MKNKKSIATGRLILLLIAVFVALILFFILPDLLGKGKKDIEDLLGSSVDNDQDGIANYFDKCKCIEGEEEFDGCPDSTLPVSPYCECPEELVPEWAMEKFDECPKPEP